MSTAPESLDVAAAGERSIRIRRDFDAPRTAIYAAHVDPTLVPRWLTGPPGWEMTGCAIDLRVGGAFRYEWQGPEEQQMALKGIFRELEAPARVVHTEAFEFGCEAQAGEQQATLELTELRGGEATRLTLTVEYPSTEARDAALASGMEQGLAASYSALDGALAS